MRPEQALDDAHERRSQRGGAESPPRVAQQSGELWRRSRSETTRSACGEQGETRRVSQQRSHALRVRPTDRHDEPVRVRFLAGAEEFLSKKTTTCRQKVVRFASVGLDPRRGAKFKEFAPRSGPERAAARSFLVFRPTEGKQRITSCRAREWEAEPQILQKFCKIDVGRQPVKKSKQAKKGSPERL